MGITIEGIKKAQKIISQYVIKTPLIYSGYFSELSSNNVYLKLENFQITGSFKIRGAMNKLCCIEPETGKKGIITRSAGNHGKAVAYGCKLKGYPCTIVMPYSSPDNKIAAIKELGAKIIFHDDIKTLHIKTDEIARNEGLTFIHSYDDPAIIAGQGTVALEIIQDLPQVDAAVMGIGGGGLIGGVSTALKSLKPGSIIIGVEPEGAATMTEGLKAGKPTVPSKIDTIADGLKPPNAGQLNIEIAKKLVDQVILLPDHEIITAVKILLNEAKILAEPAGAAALSLLINNKLDLKGKNIVFIISGGNLDLQRLKSWI